MNSRSFQWKSQGWNGRRSVTVLVNTKSSLKYGCFILFLMGSMLAWNVCGLGGRDKRRVLRNVIRKNNIDFICVLETKLEIVDEKIVNAVWGREHRSWYIYMLYLRWVYLEEFCAYGIILIFVSARLM